MKVFNINIKRDSSIDIARYFSLNRKYLVE